jgi:hypothetical protein
MCYQDKGRVCSDNILFRKVKNFLKDFGIGIPIIAGDLLRELEIRSNRSKKKHIIVLKRY